MKVVVAPDKFKGSLRATEVAKAVAKGVRDVVSDAEIVILPVADGGDGTISSLVAAGFTRREAGWARREGVDVVEMAAACGLMRARYRGRHAAMRASSKPLGSLIARTFDAGATDLVIGVGGSASTDGGAGMLQGLGAILLDRRGRPIGSGLNGVQTIAKLDLGNLPERFARVHVTLAADVDNPLLGPMGAAAVFGPQKGLRSRDWKEVDPHLARFADLLEAATGTDLREAPGAGAAGGVGHALLALGATRRPGVDWVLETIDFACAVDGADLVITGEGSIDGQTLHGKAVYGVSRAAGQRGVPVVAVCGRSKLSRAQMQAMGLARVRTLLEVQPDVSRSYVEAREILRRLAADLVSERGLAMRPATSPRPVPRPPTGGPAART